MATLQQLKDRLRQLNIAKRRGELLGAKGQPGKKKMGSWYSERIATVSSQIKNFKE